MENAGLVGNLSNWHWMLLQHLNGSLSHSNGSIHDPNMTSKVDNIDEEHCRFVKFCLYSILAPVCVMGFCGNTISILVMYRDKSAPVASLLLNVLAFADNLFLVLWMLHNCLGSYLGYIEVSITAPAYLWARILLFHFMYIGQTLTIWMTVLIALNRFMAVCVPYSAPSLCKLDNVYKEVVIVTLCSVFYNVPRFLELHVVEKTVSHPLLNSTNVTVNGVDRTEFGQSYAYTHYYRDVMYITFCFVLPLITLVVVNASVIVCYRRTQKRRQKMTSRKENENNITLVMIVVVLVFVILLAPARLVQIIWSYKFKNCKEYKFYIIHLSNALEVMNSSVNFIIYFLCRRKFKDILFANFCAAPVSNWYKTSSRNTHDNQTECSQMAEKTYMVQTTEMNNLTSSVPREHIEHDSRNKRAENGGLLVNAEN